MLSNKTAAALDEVLCFAKPRRTPNNDAELRLDALLDAQEKRDQVRKKSTTRECERSPVDRMRRIFKTQIAPVADDMRQKYADKNVLVDIDASDFLEGGRRVKIVIEYRGSGLRLDGTVMPNTIAFQQTRYTEHDRGGLTASGPTLRARELNAESFRTFVCERLTALVNAVCGR